MAEDLILSVTGEQINDSVTNGLDKNLSKLSATGKKVIDGQWINKPYTLVENGTWLAQRYEYDLSSYLPNDDNIYEVGFTGWANSKKSSLGLSVFIRPEMIDRSCSFITAGVFDNGSTYIYRGSGNIILPIDTTRKVILGIYNGSQENSVNLFCWGYRRVGSNQ